MLSLFMVFHIARIHFCAPISTMRWTFFGFNIISSLFYQKFVLFDIIPLDARRIYICILFTIAFQLMTLIHTYAYWPFVSLFFLCFCFVFVSSRNCINFLAWLNSIEYYIFADTMTMNHKALSFVSIYSKCHSNERDV